MRERCPCGDTLRVEFEDTWCYNWNPEKTGVWGTERARSGIWLLTLMAFALKSLWQAGENASGEFSSLSFLMLSAQHKVPIQEGDPPAFDRCQLEQPSMPCCYGSSRVPAPTPHSSQALLRWLGARRMVTRQARDPSIHGCSPASLSPSKTRKMSGQQRVGQLRHRNL